jgi:uncharacterized membrane protein
MEYEDKIDINAPVDDVFRFLSSVHDLPSYLPAMKEVRQEQGDHIFAVAEMAGKNVELNGFFRVDEESRRINWGSDGTPDYRGWLELRSGAPGTHLTVHLSIAGDRDDPEIRTALEHVMQSIKRIVEQQGGGQIIGEERRVA